MGFQLTVAKGQQEGKSFDFEQAEANIGRTSDNDVVLYDPGVSRKHARVFERDGRLFAEDMGSANGSKLNGQPLTQPSEVKDGDSLAVGPVVFAVRMLKAAAAAADQSTRIIGAGSIVPPVDENATRIKSAASVAPPPGRHTGASKAVTSPLKAVSQDNGALPVPTKVGRTSGAGQAIRPSAARDAVEKPSAAGPTAAERLRARRKYGDTLGGQLAYLWDGLSGRTRLVITLLTFLTVGGTGVGLYLLFKPPPDERVLGPEPVMLSRAPTMYSFGHGDEVDYPHVDQKGFEFEFAVASRAVAVLRYQAHDISQNEVLVTLNGADQGQVPADTLDRDREIELILSPASLKKGETNKLAFDNAKNPPAKDTWQVSNLSIEVIPIPEASDDELKALATDYANKGKQFLDSRDIGADNLFRAWKNYRSAWLMLEALPGEKPESYLYVRDQLAVANRELDAICRRMMLDVHRSVQLKNMEKAATTLEAIDTYFPTNEHRCHNQAHALRSKLEL